MRDGDKNSTFFHTVVKERRCHNITQISHPDGSSTTDAKWIGVDYSQSLFQATAYYLDESLFSEIQPLISSYEISDFCRTPNSEDIWQAIQQLDPSSAPGNDGFTCHFYKICWDIIKYDVIEVISNFFKGGYLPRDITDTTFMLIPKIHETRTISEYRPISLCNFSGKIISKIMANWLSVLLPNLIFEEQAGFVRGRNIAPHIVIAQELVRDIDRKSTGGNVCFKLDMAKAYDRLEWRFLLSTLRVFGFSNTRETLFTDSSAKLNILSILMGKRSDMSDPPVEFAREIRYHQSFLF